MSEQWRLEWKSYGDHGRIARGKRGNWIVMTDGMWWHLDLRHRTGSGKDQRQGRFHSRCDAMNHAESADKLITNSAAVPE